MEKIEKLLMLIQNLPLPDQLLLFTISELRLFDLPYRELQQVFLNLINNAMKYSPNRKEISVRLWQKDGFIYLEVQDKGLGIPESKQFRIFDKYYRAHAEHEKDKGGSGLGLTVVKHIVEAHGGRIELKSKVSLGSIFTIILPNKEGALLERGKQL